MKDVYIASWKDLRPYGIVYLTGESCALGYRGLVDVTANGKRLLDQVFGVDVKLADNWNHGTPDDPHIGSIMLPRCMITPIGILIAQEAGHQWIYVMKDQSVVASQLVEKPEYSDTRAQLENDCVNRYYNPGFSRHTHVFSGRTD